MKRITTLAAIVAVASAGSTLGASIVLVGEISGVEVNDWLTNSTAKSLDIDGDDVYGTHGHVHWTVAGINEQPSGSSDPGWSFLGGGGGQFSNPGYDQVDQAGNPTVDVGAGIVLNSFTFELTGTAATYENATVRVGIMHGVLAGGEDAADETKTLQILQTAGGSGDSGVVSLRSGAVPAPGTTYMTFFDITGVNPGDQFQILAGTSVPQPGYLGPVSWDLVVIPEPSSLGLGVLALAMFLGRRTRP